MGLRLNRRQMEKIAFLNLLISAGHKEDAAELRKLRGWAKPPVVRKFSASVRKSLTQIAPLSRDDRVALIKGLAMYEDSIGGIGSVTHLQRLIADLEEPVSDAFDWIVTNTSSYDYFSKGTKSWDHYMRALEGKKKRQEEHLEEERLREEAAKARNAVKATGNLLNAVRRGDIKAVTALIEKGASTDQKLESGESIHEYAIKHGYSEIASLLEPSL